MTLTILICAAGIACTAETATDVIERPATELECAMPAAALMDVADERNVGMTIIIRCDR